VEEYWGTKMLISNMRDGKSETSRVENRGHKKELTQIMSRLSNLEASARRIAENQRNQNKKME
jgi:archaellum component FlaC